MAYVTPYSIFLNDLDSEEVLYYNYNNTAIECGTKDSLKYSGIHLRGSMHNDDTLNDTINAWLIRKIDLKFYSQNVGPFYDGYPLRPGDHIRLLNGWGIYLWIGSVISGYCCIHNDNGTDQTASLFIFATFEDSLNFRSGEPPKHYILTETLTIPQGNTSCFKKWGRNKPVTVSKNSYYYFVVKFSADNMNFTSMIDYTQNTVNTSGYSHPHKFKYNTETYLKFPTGATNPTEYVAVCKAPDDPISVEKSVHIKSWGSNIFWEAFFYFNYNYIFPIVFCFWCSCLLFVLL